MDKMETSSVTNMSTDSSTMKPSLTVDQPVKFRNSFNTQTTREHQSVLQQNSRPTSIASSSGFASLGSNNVNALVRHFCFI